MGDTSPFRRLALPAPNLIREGSGRPGPRYWQQRADYDLRSSLDTAAHTISGTETLRYTNNSPDTLTYLWLQLDQNIYRANSRGAASVSLAANSSRTTPAPAYGVTSTRWPIQVAGLPNG